MESFLWKHGPLLRQPGILTPFFSFCLCQFACTVIAILLHFLYMCTFAWALLEALHIYRMLSEVRDINYGPMRFYYMVGWGVPAFITGKPCRMAI